MDSVLKCGDSAIIVIMNTPFLLVTGEHWLDHWDDKGELPSLLYGAVSNPTFNYILSLMVFKSIPVFSGDFKYVFTH
jgi:hypothetical protein